MATCRACQQPIRWATTTGKGKRLALDPSSDPDGTIRLHLSGPENGKPVTYAEILTGRNLDDALAAGELLFQAHSRLCPAEATHNPMPASVRAIRDTLPTPRTTHRRKHP